MKLIGKPLLVQAVMLLLAILAAVLPPFVEDDSGFAPLSKYTLQFDDQREVRDLVDAIRKYPDCMFIVRYRRDALVDRIFGFGKKSPELIQRDYSPQALKELASELAVLSPCVYYYRSVYCNRTENDCMSVLEHCAEKDIKNFDSMSITSEIYPESLEIGVYDCGFGKLETVEE